MKLTQRRIEALECPPNKKDMLVFDDEQRGLGIRVTAGGGKTFLVQYSHVGVKRRMRLGSCSAISLGKARLTARQVVGAVAEGKDPAIERKAAALDAKREALTLAALIEQWETIHLKRKRPNYATAATATLRRVFVKHLDQPAARLDRAVVVPVLDDLAKNGKAAMAAATARYGSALFGWAIRRGALSTNPFEHVPTAPPVRRDRVLSDAEIGAIWAATGQPGPFCGIVRMLLLTGQRREEVAGLRWDEVDPRLTTWTLPSNRTKNRKEHIVPLNATAEELLRSQPQRKTSVLVFPGDAGVFSGWSKSKRRLDEVSGVTDWTLHDIRRSVATGLQRLGVRLEVTEAVLNHVAGSRAGIIGVYQRHTWSDEKRAALNAWGEHVAAIVEGREAGGNVTEFRARGA